MSSTERSPNAGVFSTCPHCVAGLEDVTLPEHIWRGECIGSAPGGASSPHGKWDYVPSLEDASDEVAVDEEEYQQRHDLAKELADEGVWVNS